MTRFRNNCCSNRIRSLTEASRVCRTLIANSWYHSLQIRFQKRASHYISFEGNYTFSKSTDDSSAGRNAWLGNLQYDNPQLLDNLRAEHGISSNDAPHRLTAAIIVDLPFGRDRWIGGGMNPCLDAIVGGWALNSVVTLQSGQPTGSLQQRRTAG